MTNEQHNSYISWTFIGHAAFQMLILLMMVAMFSLFFFIDLPPGRPGDGPPPTAFFGFMIVFLSVFYLLFTIPSVVAAYALRRKKPWARIAAIIAAIMAAMNVPIGTAACVYSLWFFLGDNWKEIYPEKTDPFPGNHRQISFGVESQHAAYEAEKREQETFGRFEPPDWR